LPLAQALARRDARPDDPEAEVLMAGLAGPADHCAMVIEMADDLFDAVIMRRCRGSGDIEQSRCGAQRLEVLVTGGPGEQVQQLDMAWLVIQRLQAGAQ